MQTVNVECGHCGKLMAISQEHLGGQVSCPHCEGIVQAPPREPDVPEIHVPRSDAVESILGSSETELSDDIFGMPRKALVELPEPVRPPAASATAEDVVTAPAGLSPLHAGSPPTDGIASWLERRPEPAEEETAVPEVGPRRYSAKRGLVVPILLIFLIPYAIFSTGFIAWLLYSRSKAGDAMEFLRDPDPKKDGPERKGKTQLGERVKYDARLPAKLRIPLRSTAQIGDVDITPIKVDYHDGDLSMHLKLRNRSSDVTFNPLPDFFADPRTFRPNQPYTFLDAGDNTYLFGAFVRYQRGEKDGPFADGRLHSGQEMVAVLTTAPELRAQLNTILKSSRDLVWRVQIRRGLVMVDEVPRSATAVVGVEFSTRDIDRRTGAS
jgi:hypothetical protein